MLEIVAGIVLAPVLLLVILLSLHGIQDAQWHVAGPGGVHCPTCGGVCEEMSTDQSALTDFTND